MEEWKNPGRPKPQPLPAGGCAGNSAGIGRGGAGGARGSIKAVRFGAPQRSCTMKAAVLLLLVALLAFSLCHGAPDGSDAPSAKAFISHRASAEMVQRQKRNLALDGGIAGAPRDPLESKREVCELSPDCDELADQIGFQEAYRRFYGPV
ncbi:osteocalcin [Tympanuchus pallidicinctus]|uniref:osteocalcin n=1 Tax=Tympanuchus pallidicinctus TaxID=109042 RepID=UPI0022870F24|nr:osteocalcin [Tympanuchus pallidicinctus]